MRTKKNKIIRTPEERFTNLPGYNFRSNYINIDGRRIHYIDEPPASSGETILCLHGEPTWSYLYRKMIPILASAGRVLAFDFTGFGKSDKYTSKKLYTFDMHLETLTSFINALGLNDITLVVQDWGGLIGLYYTVKHPEKIKRLVIMNTGLPEGNIKYYIKTPKGRKNAVTFLLWRIFAIITGKSMPVGKIINLWTKSHLSKDVIYGYDAPFPGRKFRAGAAKWPLLVPVTVINRNASKMKEARIAMSKWEKPTLVMFSEDPITSSYKKFFYDLIPGAKAYPKITINNAYHLLQEDSGEEIAENIIKFIRNEL